MTITPLDLAWEEINAMGGLPANEYERGVKNAIDRALAVLEKLGGSDPAHRRWLQTSRVVQLDAAE